MIFIDHKDMTENGGLMEQKIAPCVGHGEWAVLQMPSEIQQIDAIIGFSSGLSYRLLSSIGQMLEYIHDEEI